MISVILECGLTEILDEYAFLQFNRNLGDTKKQSFSLFLQIHLFSFLTVRPFCSFNTLPGLPDPVCGLTLNISC